MKFTRNVVYLFMVVITLLVLFVVSGCSSNHRSSNPQIAAIEEIRPKLGLPDLPLESTGMTIMSNSPNGDLQVAAYQDSEGRIFFVNPQTNQVMEIDARTLLANIPTGTSFLSEDELRSKAQKIFTATIPNFKNLQSGWTYEEGNKGDNYFFNWYGELADGTQMRPFSQVALYRSGLLFAYYNTLLLDK
jgi:hypothetical protein